MRLKKYIYLGLIFALVFLTSIPAISAWDYNNCTDDTLFNGIIIRKNISGTVTTDIYNTTTPCTLGCADNRMECRMTANVPGEVYLSITIGLAILILVFAYLASKTHDDDWPMFALFIFSMFYIIITLISIMMGFNTHTQDSLSGMIGMLFEGFLMIFSLFVIYFFIMLIWRLFERLKRRGETKKAKERGEEE